MRADNTNAEEMETLIRVYPEWGSNRLLHCTRGGRRLGAAMLVEFFFLYREFKFGECCQFDVRVIEVPSRGAVGGWGVEWEEAGTNYRGPAVRKEDRGPSILPTFFVFLCTIRRS